jgi:hypothetical protein
LRIDAEQDVAFLQQSVRLDWHFDHATFDIGQNRRGLKMPPRIAVGSVHLLTGIRKILNTAVQIAV